MKILMVNPPFRFNDDEWITVPPQGYGGIQWIIKNLIDGLVELGHEVFLIGAPGSNSNLDKYHVYDIGSPSEISSFLSTIKDEKIIVHDHSCRGIEFRDWIDFSKCKNVIHSHYLVSKPYYKKNLIMASNAHSKSVMNMDLPYIRHPVNPSNYIFRDKKRNYLLFLGRVSSWKGAYEAALFSSLVDIPLVLAGPVWEPNYFKRILDDFGNNVTYIGEVGEEKKKILLSEARATLVFSGGLHEPTGKKWVEPGSQIVSESAISGTPIISSPNGCLSEIVPLVGTVVEDIYSLNKISAKKIIDSLPSSKEVYEKCFENWNYIKIAKEYEEYYQMVLNGYEW